MNAIVKLIRQLLGIDADIAALQAQVDRKADKRKRKGKASE